MKQIIFVISLLVFETSSNAQYIKELRIGDTLPDIKITYLIGDSLKTTMLSDFYNGKFLIIDFWATWCAACLTAINDAKPVIKQFDKLVEFLPVTYEERNKINAFQKKNNVLKNSSYSFVVEDTLLMGGYFKFTTLPHQVWIDSCGVVKAITYPDQLQIENLSSFVKNEPLNVEEKVDDVAFDPSKPLEVRSDLVVYRSVLLPYKPGFMNLIGSFTTPFKEGKQIDRFLAMNKDFLSMFYAAYSLNYGQINYERIEFCGQDSAALSPFLQKGRRTDRKLITKNSYCYELILPEKVTREEFYPYLLEDLNRISKFYASIEKREKPCWVIVNKMPSLNPTTKGEKTKLTWQSGFIKKLTNQKMDMLTAYLNWNLELPVVDKTGVNTPFDMELNTAAYSSPAGNVFLDFEKIRESLLHYGFDLIREMRPVPVLVIREKNHQ